MFNGIDGFVNGLKDWDYINYWNSQRRFLLGRFLLQRGGVKISEKELSMLDQLFRMRWDQGVQTRESFNLVNELLEEMKFTTQERVEFVDEFLDVSSSEEEEEDKEEILAQVEEPLIHQIEGELFKLRSANTAGVVAFVALKDEHAHEFQKLLLMLPWWTSYPRKLEAAFQKALSSQSLDAAQKQRLERALDLWRKTHPEDFEKRRGLHHHQMMVLFDQVTRNEREQSLLRWIMCGRRKLGLPRDIVRMIGEMTSPLDWHRAKQTRQRRMQSFSQLSTSIPERLDLFLLSFTPSDAAKVIAARTMLQTCRIDLRNDLSPQQFIHRARIISSISIRRTILRVNQMMRLLSTCGAVSDAATIPRLLNWMIEVAQVLVNRENDVDMAHVVVSAARTGIFMVTKVLLSEEELTRVSQAIANVNAAIQAHPMSAYSVRKIVSLIMMSDALNAPQPPEGHPRVLTLLHSSMSAIKLLFDWQQENRGKVVIDCDCLCDRGGLLDAFFDCCPVMDEDLVYTNLKKIVAKASLQ